MMKTQTVLEGMLVAVAGLLLHGISLAQDEVPFTDSLKEADVTLADMQDGHGSSLMIGNGDYYGIVWVRDGGLFMRVTKNDIWDARVDTSKDGDLHRIDMAAGTASGLLKAPPSYKLLYPQPRCAAALHLGPAPEAMSARLDIGKAAVSIGSGGRETTTLRILHDRNVLLVKSPHPVTLEGIKSKTLPEAELGESGGVPWLLMKMPGDVDYKGMDYALAVATRGDLKAVSLVTSFDAGNGDVLKRAVALAKETIASPEKDLVAAHDRAWRKFWSRSGVRLGDEVLQRWWYRMMFFAGTVCRTDTAPVALMPPLATDATPWHADYHHNYNVWQAFWPLPTANHPELADPWISYLNDMIPRFKFLARERYGLDGLCVPISSFLHEPDPADCKSKNRRQLSMNPWGLTVGMAGMDVQNIWQKYLCDQNLEYLKARGYPFIRETARFYCAFMQKCKRDEEGKVLLGPSYSPEHGKFGIYNCPFDIAYVHYAFDAFIEAAGELGTDGDLIEKCRKYKALLGTYPTALDGNGKPVVVDWEGCKYRQVSKHNIEVPASPVFPADQVTWFSPESEKELFRRTIREVRQTGSNSHVMLNVARARLSMPEAVERAKAFFLPRELPNGFIRMPWAHGTFMQETIGLVGLVNEFLLQSVENKIRLFPCWPEDKDARFSRLRAQGGFIVSAEFKGGRVVSARVESVSNRKLRILSPWKTAHVNGKKVAVDNNGLVIMKTKPGQVFILAETKMESAEAP
jgi:hypothetical protein